MSKKLKLIDFSQGIKSTEVQHNFEVLQNQLNKERISVAGSGIAYGLNFTIEDFVLKIEEGCLINKKGEEVYIDETNITIPCASSSNNWGNTTYDWIAISA